MIHNPAGLYGGGAFLVDTRPILNLVAKKQVQDQAKKTALTKYFTDLTDKATATGIRNQELPAYTQSVDNYKDYWLKNSEDILNGDLAKQMEAQRLAKMPSKIAAESKNLRVTDLDVAKATLGNKDFKDTWTDQTNEAWNKHEQPRYIVSGTGEVIENPNHEPLDITTMTFNPKLLSESEMQDKADKQVDDIKPVQLGAPTVQEYKADPYQQLEVTSFGHNKDNLLAMGQKFKELYKDPSVSFTFNKRHPLDELNNQNLPELSAANKLFKEVYGKDIETNEDLYVAKNMYQKALPKTEQKLVPNTAYRERMQEQKERRLIGIRKAGEAKPAVDIDNIELEMDRIAPGTAKTTGGAQVQIKNNRIYNLDGTPYNSPKGVQDVIITGNSIPVAVRNAAPTGETKIATDRVKYSVKNGVPQQVSGDFIGTLSRDYFVPAELKGTGIKKPVTKLEETKKIQVPSTPKKAKDKYGF